MRQNYSMLVMVAGLGMTAAVMAAPLGNQNQNKSNNGSENKFTPKVEKTDPGKDNKKVDIIDLPKLDKKDKVDLKKVDKVDLPKIDLPKFDKKVEKVDPKVDVKPLIFEPKGKLQGLPGLKLPGDVKVDAGDIAKFKPILDAKKLKPGDLGQLKPPADFQPKKLDLNKLKIPDNAPVIDKFNPELVLKNKDKFVLNKNFCMTGDYHLKFGKKFGNAWCFPGINHCHWHHCIWDPYYCCNYFYCPCTCCYYYWCVADNCYYPCWWFMDCGNCYYPWWLCSDFGVQIYGSGFNLHIGF